MIDKLKGSVSKVSAVKCSSYKSKKVENAVREALELIDFEIKPRSKVLLKPNVVGVFPKSQLEATTNPLVVEAVCKILKEKNCKIFIGDSPFTNAANSFKAAGLDKIAKKYGKLIIFEQNKLIDVKNKNAKYLKKFQIAKIVKDVDLVINMPKLKTHKLAKYTGAIKNLYGLIPGGMKQRLHLRAKGDKDFSELLIDIYQKVQPELNIMDGVIGMEGEGPTSGDAVKVGLILASKNSVALDIACSKMIGLNPKKVFAIKEAVKRKLYPNFKFELVGEKLPKLKFKKPSGGSGKTQKLMDRIFKEKPIVCDTKKCVKCRLCEKHCPAKAITMEPYPIINAKKCIRCYCCIEICPQDALSLKK